MEKNLPDCPGFSSKDPLSYCSNPVPERPGLKSVSSVQKGGTIEKTSTYSVLSWDSSVCRRGKLPPEKGRPWICRGAAERSAQQVGGACVWADNRGREAPPRGETPPTPEVTMTYLLHTRYASKSSRFHHI